MTAKQRQAGVAAIWVVILVLLALGTVTWGVLAYIDYEDLRERQWKIELQIEDVQKDTAELAGTLPTLVPGTGFSPQENSLPVQDAIQWTQTHRYNAEQKDAKMLPLRRDDDRFGEIMSHAGIAPDQFENKLENSTFWRYPEDLAQLALLRAMTWRYRHDFHMHRKNMIEQHPGIIEAQSKAMPFSDNKPVIRQEILKKIGEIRQLMSKEESEFNQHRNSLQQQLDRIRDLRSRRLRQHPRRKKILEDEIQKQRNIFEDLLRTKHPVFWKLNRMAVHGHLVQPDIQQRQGWIDIGSRHRVVPGLHFLVAVRGTRNTFVWKGEVEVKRVFLTSAEVRIVEVFDKDRPLIHGDVLVNPLFNQHRPLKLAFAGAERPPGHEYSRTDAKRRLIEYNNIVQDKVDVDTDFLIWTDFNVDYSMEDPYEEPEVEPPGEYPENWKTAALIGTPIADAKVLYRFMGD